MFIGNLLGSQIKDGEMKEAKKIVEMSFSLCMASGISAGFSAFLHVFFEYFCDIKTLAITVDNDHLLRFWNDAIVNGCAQFLLIDLVGLVFAALFFIWLEEGTTHSLCISLTRIPFHAQVLSRICDLYSWSGFLLVSISSRVHFFNLTKRKEEQLML
jgi:hypothetical protein